MAVTYKGQRDYLQVAHPVVTKNEFGVDVLAVRFNGDITRQAAFVQSLRQGDAFTYGRTQFYLQTWQSEEGRAYGPVTLFYKGFLNGATPNPYEMEDTQEVAGTKSVTTPENRVYDFVYVQPVKIVRIVTNDSQGEPSINITVGIPVIIRSYYTKDDGTRRSGLPSGLAYTQRLISSRKVPIYGTPFFEREYTAAGVVDT